jgi:hypothetical protein
LRTLIVRMMFSMGHKGDKPFLSPLCPLSNQ